MADAAPRASRAPGVVAAFLGVLVAFNTLVYSCSNDRLAREDAQLQRLASEEDFWTEAMKDLSALVAERGKTEADAATWDSRCKLLALRTSPFSFDASGRGGRDEGDESMSARAQAQQARIELLKLAFTQRIQDPQFVTDGCRQTFESQQFAAAQADVASTVADSPVDATKTEGADVPSAYQADTAVSSAIAQRSNIIALTPTSPTGWDIDVFWCDRRTEAAAAHNYGEALSIARVLAGKAQNGERVGGQALGRIRARILPLNQQNPALFPVAGATIRADGGTGEADLADALVVALPGHELHATPIGRRTRWYLSMFLCREQDAAPPAPAG